MKRESQIRAIAQLCGWNPRPNGGFRSPKTGFTEYLYTEDGPPDYTDCLNAIHEAENILLVDKNGLWYPYCRLLHKSNGGIGEGATAAQRAEAFLRTLNLWES